MSTLLRTTTIFLPHSRICPRKARSLSVNGRSAEVTKSTRSARGTNSRVIASCSRMMALVPGVSTMVISRSSSAGSGDHVERRSTRLALQLLAVAQQVDPRGGGRDPFVEHLVPEQGVDEGALAGVELAGDDQQKQLVELRGRLLQRRLILRRRIEPRQRLAQLRQQPAVSARISSCPLSRIRRSMGFSPLVPALEDDSTRRAGAKPGHRNTSPPAPSHRPPAQPRERGERPEVARAGCPSPGGGVGGRWERGRG